MRCEFCNEEYQEENKMDHYKGTCLIDLPETDYRVTRYKQLTGTRERAKKIAREITDYINVMGDSVAIQYLVEEMSCQHRTLQQGFTRVVVSWLWHLAELKGSEYDGRNEDSVKLARKLLKGLDKYDTHLPLI